MMALRQLSLDFLGEPDLQGHKHFCAPMCDIWIAHYGPGSIDAYNLAMFKDLPPVSCPRCRVDKLPARERRLVLAALARRAA